MGVYKVRRERKKKDEERREWTKFQWTLLDARNFIAKAHLLRREENPQILNKLGYQEPLVIFMHTAQNWASIFPLVLVLWVA